MAKKNHSIQAISKETAAVNLSPNNTGYTLRLYKRFYVYLLPVIFLCVVVQSNCFNRSRFNNFNWQLDSIRYYTIKLDSMLEKQNEEITHLRIDFYTKTSELSEKIEMLNSRIGDTESQLTTLSHKLGPQHKTGSEDDDISKLSPEARLIYESAYLNYVKGNYLEAISGFQSYLKTTPDSPLSDNALYWIGESYAAMGKSQNAVNTFQEIINKYPESNKRPTALYKIAIIYEETGDSKTARHYYSLVIKDFPNSPEATLAQDKLQK